MGCILAAGSCSVGLIILPDRSCRPATGVSLSDRTGVSGGELAIFSEDNGFNVSSVITVELSSLFFSS